jgi:hypothetical protein
MSGSDQENNNAALFQEESDKESTNTDSEQDVDYPDSDSEIVQEVTKIIDSTVDDQNRDSQNEVNNKVVARLEDSVTNQFLINESRRIYNILLKFNIDHSDIAMYSFHIASLFVNDINFPETHRDILENIIEYVRIENLGYSKI